MQDGDALPLPIGFERFHRRSFVNYQMNRAHALAFGDAREMHVAAKEIRRERRP